LSGLAEALDRFALTLWVGGLWAIGYLAAPALFAALPEDRVLAGALAGRLFSLIAWIGIGCGTWLLVHAGLREKGRAPRSWRFWLIAAMLALTLAGHFGVQPVMAALKAEAGGAAMQGALRERFALWHGISSTLYLIQSLFALALVLRSRR
jgi:hypothetical protein